MQQVPAAAWRLSVRFSSSNVSNSTRGGRPGRMKLNAGAIETITVCRLYHFENCVFAQRTFFALQGAADAA